MPEKAIELFWQVRYPDEVIIILLFNACAQLANDEALDLVKKVATKLHGVSLLELASGHFSVGFTDEVWRYDKSSVTLRCSTQENRPHVWRIDGR